MIAINLIEKKRGSKAVVVLGVDIRTINFKALGFAILLFYIPKNYMKGVWESEISGLNQQVEVLNKNLKDLQKELQGYENIKEQLSSYNAQIERLRQRSEQVDRILKEKTSPKMLLERLARSSPVDLWFDELLILEDRTFSLKGGAESYKSIGDLIVNMNDTPYFRGTLNLAKSETLNEVEGGREVRTESYEITGKIESFEIVGR
jgi:prefoldin subunit 5